MIKYLLLCFTSDNFLRVKIFFDEFNLEKIVQSTYYDVSFHLKLFLLTQ